MWPTTSNANGPQTKKDMEYSRKETDGQHLYVVALWLTRCTSQRVDMIYYDPDENQCFKVDSCVNYLESREPLLGGVPPVDLDPQVVQE